MKRVRISVVLVLLVASVGLSAIPVFAACTPADGNGGNNSILCDVNNQIIDGAVNSISGRAGNDTLDIRQFGGDNDDDVYGDNATATGDDTIYIDSIIDVVSGDVDSNGTYSGAHIGGDDRIYLYNDADANYVRGDDMLQKSGDTFPVGGHDYIWMLVGSEVNFSIQGDYLDAGSGGISGGKGGNDSVFIQGLVRQHVYGDWSFGSASADGGNDSIQVYNAGQGQVNGSIYGDYVTDDGGNDRLLVYSNVLGNVYGDFLTGGSCCYNEGGNDYIYVGNGGYVGGSVYGDYVTSTIYNGEGGDDTIVVVNGGIVNNNVIGDQLWYKDATGGKDSILIQGQVYGYVAGDNDTFDARSGRDTITVGNTGRVWGSVSGDRTKKAGSKDTITISGTVDQSVFGDNTNRGSGADKIVVEVGGLVKKNVLGDQGKTIAGGNDKIEIRGTVNKNVVGDSFRATVKPDVDGGDDTITVFNGALVKGDVVGDDAPDNGGRDSITIAGTVNGDVVGDRVGDRGGIDTIRVNGNGVVKGDVIGDDAGIPATPANGGDDLIIVNGVVQGTVWLDNVGGPIGPDVAASADVSGIDFAAGGSDVVYVAGQITGNISSASGRDGDDVFVIADGGVVGGMMDAGAHIDGDSLIFDLSTKSKGEFNNLSELFDGLTVEDGTVRYRGNRYNWVNFEFLQYAVQLFQTRYIEPRCGGIYELNEAGTGCQRKGAEEYDAIMFHRNNPGYDGRLPGTEACAVYNYGNAMRVYEVVDGSEGELVTTISADVFSHTIESNLLLASSASGNVNVYYLTSNEVQVECTDWTGKTQVRIIPDFSGTVNASFDKTQG